MTIQCRTLPENYLADDQLPALLRKFEGDVPVPYADSKGIATIGIGFNIRENQNYLALVLQELGVFAASDAQDLQRRATGNLPAESEAERNDRYKTVLSRFVNIVEANPITADRTAEPGNSPSEISLKTELDQELGRYSNWGSATSFSLDSQTQTLHILRQIVEGFVIGPDLDGDGAGQFLIDSGKQTRLDARLAGALDATRVPYAVNVPHDTYEYVALMSLFFNVEGRQVRPGRFTSDALVGNGLLSALSKGNRAEAWYEVRYNSNGGSSRSPGVARRRYAESQILGLFNDDSNVGLDEAKERAQSRSV